MASNDWICPITMSLMRDPVIAPDGHSYERSAIVQWFAQSSLSPKTGLRLASTDLIPNHALRNTIEDFVRANPQFVTQTVGPAFKEESLTLDGTFYASGSSKFLHLNVASPSAGARQSIVLIAIVDNSGSMGEVADTNSLESFGYTRMDLVKHSIRTMASILGPEDMLAIVKYSTTAQLVIKPTLMTDLGRQKIFTALDTIQPDSQTNIYDGIRVAAEVANAPELAGRHIVGLLLTDGISNADPPRGIVPTLKNMQMKNQWSLHTFGFGYNLDSPLLTGISEWGSGVFGFIPDCTMVGTIFINFIATVLATSNRDALIEITTDAGNLEVKTGEIQYGQPRDLILELPSGATSVRCKAGSTTKTFALSDAPPFIEARRVFLDSIRGAMVMAKRGSKDASTILCAAVTALSKVADPRAKELLKDIESDDPSQGQIGMAPKFFEKWGKHYMSSYLRAQELQQSMNFKDPGLQIYGGELFKELQAKAETIFGALPPPIPSSRPVEPKINPNYTPTSMSVFHNSSGGCFSGECTVKMADGSLIPIKAVNPGDLVWTPSGSATVLALVTCGSNKKTQPMVQMNKLCITPWHPILEKDKWVFPGSIVLYSERLINTVYNLVLDKGHIVNVEGYDCCTLAHGFKGPVIEHEFFGTDKVIESLKKADGWSVGRPTFKNLTTVKGADGKIAAWVDSE